MNISILPYLDEAAVASLQEQAQIRAAALRDQAAMQQTSETADFGALLQEQTELIQSSTTSETSSASASVSACSATDLEGYFNEASNIFGVSTDLLKAIAKTESNFNPSAISTAGAIGIMQLMPETAKSLGVTNSYDARENILGGAKLISQLLVKYNGDTSLALAAYNAGSGNVDKYGGIPPFKETQNYVVKVLTYLGQDITIPSNNATVADSTASESSSLSSIFDLTGEAREEANKMLEEFFTSKNITKEALDTMVAILKLMKMAASKET